MPPLSQARLYGILDLGYVQPGRAVETAQSMIEGGIDVIQLRAKDLSPREIEKLAVRVHAITRPARVPLVINDHPAVATAAEAEGVHLGQDDMALADARKCVPPGCFIGVSTHSREQARAAAHQGADYIGFGPLFSTPTKPDYPAIGLEDIRWIRENISLPAFCIGGIKRENVQRVIDAGATRVVIVSGILAAADIPDYIRDVKSVLPPLNNE